MTLMMISYSDHVRTRFPIFELRLAQRRWLILYIPIHVLQILTKKFILRRMPDTSCRPPSLFAREFWVGVLCDVNQ